jgi:hypothetical protein
LAISTTLPFLKSPLAGLPKNISFFNLRMKSIAELVKVLNASHFEKSDPLENLSAGIIDLH